MSRVDIRIDKYLEGQASVAAGEILSSRGRVLQQVLIPVNMFGKGISMELEPGDYVARATMPSGALVSEGFTVEEDRNLEVALDAGHSRHEWLSWHHFTTGVGELEPGRQFQYVAADQPIRGIEPSSPVLFVDTRNESISIPLARRAAFGNREIGFESAIERDQECTVLAINATTFADDRTKWPRVYVSVSIGGSPEQIVALPTPWPNPFRASDPYEPEETFPVEIMLVDEGEPTEPGAPPLRGIGSIVVRDPQFGPLLAYLARHDPHAKPLADSVIRDAEQLLFQKFQNPYAAAAGGYLLVQGRAGEGPAKWRAWARRLADRFTWLPDGAIIYGTYLLDWADEPDEARKYLLAAAERGIPAYTEGIRLLVSGLNTLVDDRRTRVDKQLRDALTQANRLASLVHPRVPFCTFFEGDLSSGKGPRSPFKPPRGVSPKLEMVTMLDPVVVEDVLRRDDMITGA